MAGGYPTGAVIGGIVASALLAATGRWQSVFVFGALASAAFIPLVVWLLPETVAFLCVRRPPNALARINRTLIGQGRAALAMLPPPVPVAVADVGRGADRGRSAATTRLTILLVVAYFCHIMTFYFLMKWTPKVVADMGFAPAQAGGVLVWANVGGALGSVFLSLLTQRYDVRRLVSGAMIGGAVAVAALGQGITSLTGLSLAAGIAGFFTNGATAGLYAVLAQVFPARTRAGGTGLVIGIGRGGAALGPVLAGVLFSLGWPLHLVTTVMASGCLLGAVVLQGVHPAVEA